MSDMMSKINYCAKVALSLIAVVSLITLGALNAAYAQTVSDNDGTDDAAMHDPLESFNRAMHHVNYTLDGLVVRPVTKIYRGVVPQVGRKGVSNFLSNLSSPVTLVNSVLQGDPENAFKTFWRFMFNSTFGLGGVIDVAGYYGLHANNEDFGQTMGVYGVEPGAYLVIPVLGPSSARDLPGRVVDFFTDPFNYLVSDGWIAARAGLSAVDTRSRNFKLIDRIYEDSLDPYATIRSGYMQRRQSEINKRGSARAQVKD